jgi:hypothetical protein
VGKLGGAEGEEAYGSAVDDDDDHHHHHHHYHDDDDDDDIVGLLVHIGRGAAEAGEVARRLTQELGVPSVAHLSELEVRLNDAPCPPFTSHGASIMLQ